MTDAPVYIEARTSIYWGAHVNILARPYIYWRAPTINAINAINASINEINAIDEINAINVFICINVSSVEIGLLVGDRSSSLPLELLTALRAALREHRALPPPLLAGTHMQERWSSNSCASTLLSLCSLRSAAGEQRAERCSVLSESSAERCEESYGAALLTTRSHGGLRGALLTARSLGALS